MPEAARGTAIISSEKKRKYMTFLALWSGVPKMRVQAGPGS